MSNSSQSVVTQPAKRSAENADRPKGKKVVDKSTRVSHACELCREKRARCNGERPTCQRCAKLGIECQYGLAKNDRRRKEIEDLQRQVAEYEGLLESLTPNLDGDSRERFLALRHDSARAESPTRSENDQSSAPYTGSAPSSLQLMSPPPLVQGGESASSMSGSTAISQPVRPVQLRLSSGANPFQPFSSPDQVSPKQRNTSSALSQDSAPSLMNSVTEWQKGFIYTTTETIVPPRDVTERAIKAFFSASTMLLDLFEGPEIDEILHSVYETRPSPKRTIALCQLCITAAVGCQYDWDQFPDHTGKSFLAVAKLYIEEIIETHALSAMRVMALLAMYFSFEKRMSSLVYIDSGLAIARAQQVDSMTPTRETRRWKRTWCSLVFLGSWIASTVGRSIDPANHFHPSMLKWGSTMSMPDTIQLEMCKVAHLTGRILTDVYHAPSVDTGVVNMYKAELESWLFSLPGFMRIDSLLANGSNEIPMRPIFLLHLLYLSSMGLIYRRILSEFAESPESLISNTTMEDVKHHLDACLWSSKQVSRILSVAMLNGHVTRKCWMFIHGAYCANNILLYFAANKLLQNPGSDGVAEDIMASEQCIRTLEHCAVADDSASHFLKHVKPLHIAISQMHMVSRTTAPRNVVPISNLISEYLDAPRANIPVGDDLPQMQRTIVSIIQALLQSPVERTRFQPRPDAGRRDSASAALYPDPEMDVSVPVSGFQRGDGARSAAQSLRNYFWDDSLGQLAFKNDH